MGPFEKSESSSIAETDVGRERDTTWMTSETLTFEERSRLMHQDHEKWWKEVNERHEKESRSPSSFFSAIFCTLQILICTNIAHTYANYDYYVLQFSFCGLFFPFYSWSLSVPY